MRPDNRVGEALLTTPLLRTLKAHVHPAPEVHVLVHAKVARVLSGHPDADAVVAFDRRRLWLGPLAPGLRALRRAGYDTVVDCANWENPSVTSALVSRMARAPAPSSWGPAVWPVSRLHSLSVPARPDTRNEAVQRTHLLTPLTGGAVARGLSFREPVVGPAFRAYLRGGQRHGRRGHQPRAAAWASGAFRPRPSPPLPATLLELGRVPIVTWGPGEEELAPAAWWRPRPVPGSRPATNLDELAALMRAAGFTVCNNTGPMHLSVAVGAPTLAFFLRMDMERWGHAMPPHRMVDLTPLVDGATGARALEARAADEVRAFAAGCVGPLTVPAGAVSRMRSGTSCGMPSSTGQARWQRGQRTSVRGPSSCTLERALAPGTAQHGPQHRHPAAARATSCLRGRGAGPAPWCCGPSGLRTPPCGLRRRGPRPPRGCCPACSPCPSRARPASARG